MTSQSRSRITGRNQIAFVAGATGATGSALVDVLLARGIKVIAHVRPDNRELDDWAEKLASKGATVNLTQWQQIDVSRTLVRIKPAYVFCMLGSNPERTRKRGKRKPNPFVDSYQAVDYGLSAMLVRAAASSGSRPRFILPSSTLVRPNSKDEFIESKFRIEEFLKHSGLPYTIVRVEKIRSTSNPRVKKTPALQLRSILNASKIRRWSASPGETASLLANIALDPKQTDRILEPRDVFGS